MKKLIKSFKTWNRQRKEAAFFGLPKRSYYKEYGKAYRFTIQDLKKCAIVIDTVIPMTFFIPVILVNIVGFFVGKDKEFWIVRKHE